MIFANEVTLDADLRQTHPNNHNADQPLPHQVNSLAEDSTQNGKPNHSFSRAALKLPHKLVALIFSHSGLLHERSAPRKQLGEPLQHLQQIIVGGEINEVIACSCLYERMD